MSDFSKHITAEPAFGPLTADQEPTPEEQDARDDAVAEMMTFMYGDNSDSVLGVMSNARELYQGVGQAAYHILNATKTKFEKGDVQLPSAAIFGEGGMIHSAVEELMQLAQAAGLPGSDDQDQYHAAMFETYRLVGEHIQSSGEDGSIAEAQELLIDVETAGGNMSTAPGLNPGQEEDLQGAIERSLHDKEQMAQGGVSAGDFAPDEAAAQSRSPVGGV